MREVEERNKEAKVGEGEEEKRKKGYHDFYVDIVDRRNKRERERESKREKRDGRIKRREEHPWRKQNHPCDLRASWCH